MRSILSFIICTLFSFNFNSLEPLPNIEIKSVFHDEVELHFNLHIENYSAGELNISINNNDADIRLSNDFKNHSILLTNRFELLDPSDLCINFRNGEVRVFKEGNEITSEFEILNHGFSLEKDFSISNGKIYSGDKFLFSSLYLSKSSLCKPNVRTSGINCMEIDAVDFSFYPIPSIDFVDVTFHNDDKKYSYKLYDALGKMITASSQIVEKSHTIHLAQYDAGTYFLVLDVDGELISKKIIKL